ncbi:autophagy protein 16, interacts with Atg12p-Atg5p [Lithohypha guttulata]|nr:autophagy protein 16, interacts with Atg12p-Atg5p [Lithohypha guttulata]
MADWKVQYLSALKARHEAAKADIEIYDKHQNADLRAELRQIQAAIRAVPTRAPPVPAPLISYGFRRQTPIIESDIMAQLRQDFSIAQQERADLQKQVEVLRSDLEQATTKLKTHEEQVSRLTNLNSRFTTRMKDHEEELRGKARLLENVQDENATLNLELDQAEQEVKKVKKENKELVDRWVARMGQEAEKMNEDSKFS